MVTNENHDLSIICYVKIWVKEGEKCGGRINIMFMPSHNFSFEGKIRGIKHERRNTHVWIYQQ